MSETNGTVANRITTRAKRGGVTGISVGAGLVAGKPKPTRRGKRAVQGAKRLALAVGGVGVGVLGLSVAHCTESIGQLTGSGWVLSGLLAVGIDAGMVAAECAELAAVGTVAAGRVCGWARGYTIGAVLLSILLNGFAFAAHAPAGMGWAAWLLGACVPVGVYALGRIAAGLWMSAGE